MTGFYSLRFSSTGLERAEDPVLNGSDERLFGRRLADFFTGRDPAGERRHDDPPAGAAGRLAWLQQSCDGGCRGSVVALEPSTGKILAMVSAPSHDPNLLATHDPEAQGQDWERLRDEAGSPLTNRAIAERYPPGSTFKVITTAAALQAGMSEDEQLTAAPKMTLPNSTATLENYGGMPCGNAPRHRCGGLRAVLQHRVRRARHPHRPRGAAQHGRGVRIRQSAGADSAAGRGVHGRTDGRCRRGRHVSHGAEGRGGDPAAERDGCRRDRQFRVVMKPYLVDRLVGPDLTDVNTTSPSEQRRAISAQVAAKLTDLMVGAEKFTQRDGAIPGVQIASKTGTAEHGTDPRNTPPHAWYIAFAPAQDPKVAVAVMVENGGDRLSATGGALAAPIGRATIAAALQGAS